MAEQEPMSIKDFFNNANSKNMDEICRQFYADDIRFEDPLGSIDGIDNLIKYYQNLYENLTAIEFVPLNNFTKQNEQVFVWQMILRHKKVGGGDPIIVDGTSVFKYRDGRVIYHRDYFDLGAMIYEKIPVLGSLIRFIKEKAHGQNVAPSPRG